MKKVSERIEYLLYAFGGRLTWLTKAVFRRLFKIALPERKSIVGQAIHSKEEGNQKLYDMIMSGKPFCAIRYGGTELQAMCAAKRYNLGLDKEPSQHAIDKLQRQSGFFPPDPSLLEKFNNIYVDCSKDIDLLFLLRLYMSNYIVKKNVDKSVPIYEPEALEPFYFQFKQPWSAALKGKRVLVIHPFAETIEEQYQKHELLFKDKNVLPDFELYTLKAVQTIVGTKDERFDTWFDALEWMYQKAMKIPFDVALLGCGAYGLPLTVKLKRAGKQAIYIGGGLQLVFGIKGKRWDTHFPIMSNMYNENWNRPSQAETPLNKAKNEDNGAYW